MTAPLVVLLVVAVGCDGPTEPDDPASILSENRQRFAANVGASYQYEYQNVCFCGPDTRTPVRVTVRDGVRTSVVSVADGSPLPRERWSDFLTVTEVFDDIERALQQGAASVRVEYDAALGYPRDVFIDVDERLADEERGYALSDLAVSR